MVKNGQHQHKDRPHAREKSRGAATSVADAIIILSSLNLSGAYGSSCRFAKVNKLWLTIFEGGLHSVLVYKQSASS
jgi:hypothetical protein